MQHEEKVELISLLNEFRSLLPPKEERKHLTNHYAQVERRIEEAKKKLMDKDYWYVHGVNKKLLELQLEGKITIDEYMKYAKMEPQ